MTRHWPLLLSPALFLALVAPAAGDDTVGQKTRVDARIAQLQHEIGASESQAGVLTSQLSAVAEALRSAQSAVDDAQQTLDRLSGELAAQRARLAQLSTQLRVETTRLRRLQDEYRAAMHVLEQRVRARYMTEQPDVLSVLASVSSLSELVDNVEFLNRIGIQDERIVRQVASAKAHAAAARKGTLETRRQVEETVAVISARTDEARKARDALAVNRDSLLSAQRLKTGALSRARETRQEYLAEVQALETESAALGARIQAAQIQSAPTAPAPSAAGLAWPVSGPVTSGFGMRWGRMHTGIDIAVPSGTPVHAAAGGTVVYAGWMSGYGYLVAIDHGTGLATAYAHNSSLLVTVGARVGQGQVVSLSGSTGHSTGPHVHFEVRVNGVPVDPLQYL